MIFLDLPVLDVAALRCFSLGSLCGRTCVRPFLNVMFSSSSYNLSIVEKLVLTKDCLQIIKKSREKGDIWLKGDSNRATISSIHPVYIIYAYCIYVETINKIQKEIKNLTIIIKKIILAKIKS